MKLKITTKEVKNMLIKMSNWLNHSEILFFLVGTFVTSVIAHNLVFALTRVEEGLFFTIAITSFILFIFSMLVLIVDSLFNQTRQHTGGRLT